jgi:cation-transporting ATPase E
LIVYLLYQDQSLQLQRTVLTTTALLCGLLLIVFAEHSIDEWVSRKKMRNDWRRMALAGVMLALYLLIFAVPSIRNFFELSTMAWKDLGVVLAAVLVWAVVVRLLWQYDVFKRVLIPTNN